MRRMLCGLMTLLTVGGLFACGEDAPPTGDSLPALTCTLQDEADVDKLGRVATPVIGVAYGQEIWVSWQDREHKFGFRYPRTEQRALFLARRACREFEAGGDLGAMARRISNAPGGRADGFCVLPREKNDPDVRDRALLLTPVGQRTPLLKWRGGYWFAQRVDDAKGRQLEKKFRYVIQQRAKARVIVLHHDGAFPKRVREKPYSQAQAIAHAQGILGALKNGDSFDKLAMKYSHDKESGARGGLIHATDSRAGESPEWIRWGDRGYPQTLLDLIMENGVVGSVHPAPVITRRGVMVVEVLERRP